MDLVRRHTIPLGYLGRACPSGTELFIEPYALLGDGLRRIRRHQGTHRRALCPLVPIRLIQSAFSVPRSHLAFAPALGVEYRRVRSDRNSRPARSIRTAQR